MEKGRAHLSNLKKHMVGEFSDFVAASIAPCSNLDKTISKDLAKNPSLRHEDYACSWGEDIAN